MFKEGMFVRCPIDKEYPDDPRLFATGKIISVDEFNECAQIKFYDPYGFKKYFEYIPDVVDDAPLEMLDHCHLFKDSIVKYGRRDATVIEYKHKKDDLTEYYIQTNDTKEYLHVDETKIIASFFSGSANPEHQLENYEFQNPCWYLGRQIVKETMNVLDNSIFGFKELAGCKIYLKAFQLNTIMQCLQSEQCRYMLADEVGLGKTIEACAVLKIYLSNKADQKVLIAVPNALVAQWRTELLFKFGIIEGNNEHGNNVQLIAVEQVHEVMAKQKWNFVVVDEVHNYLKSEKYYERVHALSVNADNIILLSATPIQQRQNEYLSLLRLILPDKYDDISLDDFTCLVEKQKKISRLAHELLDEIDSFKNEILPEVESDNPLDDEDVQDGLEEICDNLDSIADIIGDHKLSEMVEAVDTTSQDFGIYAIQVIISYICDNYQIERNIIRGRRAVLGVYPNDPDGEFSERKLEEVTYSINEEENFYENEAHRTLTEWIVSQQSELDAERIDREIKPILEAFFSSAWAYVSRLEEAKKIGASIPNDVFTSANRWLEDEKTVYKDLANAMDDVESHPSRLLKLINFIDTALFGEKIVVFTDQPETFEVYCDLLQSAFGDEVTCFGASIDETENEINIYRFQSDDDCKILICDKTGGEGRNLQIADYVVHIDLPWNINSIEQRIGRLDRMGRDVEKPVTSVVIHSIDTYEDQLFKLWNEGLNVFSQSLSGLEIIMNDINNKITESIGSDFEYGLYRLIPELIEESKSMRESVHKEQIFDTAALRFKPLYLQLKKLLSNYQFNENKLFADTMMSWASLAGFGKLNHQKDSSFVSFDENNFSLKSAQNSFLIPPNWNNYLSKKQNEVAIRVQRGLEERKERNTTHSDRMIKGSFDRDTAIKNDYIHFYAPGDEVFDCIVDNAMHSYRGMCTAFAALSSMDWKGFIYTFSIEPNERALLEEGVSLFALGQFRQYLSSSIQVVPVAFSTYADVQEKMVISEHKRLCKMGYFNQSDEIEHLGRRGYSDGFMHISRQYNSSNLDWFKAQFDEEQWKKLVEKSKEIAFKKARSRFLKESDLEGAKELINQIVSTKESRERYFGTTSEESVEELKHQYELIFKSLEKPIIRLEAACFLWLVKK